VQKALSCEEQDGAGLKRDRREDPDRCGLFLGSALKELLLEHHDNGNDLVFEEPQPHVEQQEQDLAGRRRNQNIANHVGFKVIFG
jgi:hypothetical protein